MTSRILGVQVTSSDATSAGPVRASTAMDPSVAISTPARIGPGALSPLMQSASVDVTRPRASSGDGSQQVADQDDVGRGDQQPDQREGRAETLKSGGDREYREQDGCRPECGEHRREATELADHKWCDDRANDAAGGADRERGTDLKRGRAGAVCDHDHDHVDR